MVIKASSAKQIEVLVRDLSAESAVTREAAVARLTVIGARAVERLLALVESKAPGAARIASLRALEAIADGRALDVALRTIDDPDAAVASAAISTARVFISGPRGAVAVDRLTQVALDRARSEHVRLTAVQSLTDLHASTLKPLKEALTADPSADIQAAAQSLGSTPATLRADPVEIVVEAAEHGLPDDPSLLRRAIAHGADRVGLPLLHRLIERIRDHEASQPPDRRTEWMAARAAAHVALANRGSRIALYDLRESLEQSSAPLPVDFLAALSLVGDASCLEAIAAAYARPSDSDWWQRHLLDAFRAIVAREGLTRRHGVIKKLQRRSPDVTSELLGR